METSAQSPQIIFLDRERQTLNSWQRPKLQLETDTNLGWKSSDFVLHTVWASWPKANAVDDNKEQQYSTEILALKKPVLRYQLLKKETILRFPHRPIITN